LHAIPLTVRFDLHDHTQPVRSGEGEAANEKSGGVVDHPDRNPFGSEQSGTHFAFGLTDVGGQRDARIQVLITENELESTQVKQVTSGGSAMPAGHLKQFHILAAGNPAFREQGELVGNGEPVGKGDKNTDIALQAVSLELPHHPDGGQIEEEFLIRRQRLPMSLNQLLGRYCQAGREQTERQ